MTQMDPNPGGIESHLGYVISGTSKDGLYLETRTNTNGSPSPISSGEVYYLDTRPGDDPAPPYPALRPGLGTSCPAVAANTLPTPANQLPCLPSWDRPTSRTFTVSSTPSGPGSFIPQNALWYAAKYGGARVMDSNGDPTNYFKVTNPANLPDQMGKAFRSAAALAAVASTSVVGVGQRSLGTAAIYQANYDSLTWSSRLYAFSVGGDGTVANAPLWEASHLLGTPATRTKLFLGRGGSTAPVHLATGGFATLSPAEQADFGNTDIYQYLLGDTSKEERKAGGIYRNRGLTSASDVSTFDDDNNPATPDVLTYSSILGDIVNSDPQIISKKDYGYSAGDTDYGAFLSSLTTESLAVGTNNGFFHIFDAAPTISGGTELFGFIPQAARTNIKDLSVPDYVHRYFVDGAIGQGHAKIPVPGDGSTSWRTVVVTAGGAGAKTVFAVNATTQSYSANSVLWEINENTTLPTPGTLGNVMGRPAIGKLANGTWVAIFGNGYNSTVGNASLFVVNLATGAIIKQIATNSVGANGLGSTEMVRITTGNKDTIELVYGADYKGNIWRFNLSAVDPNTWPTTGALIYSTPTGRPITAEIKVGAATGVASLLGNRMVYFGTGTYLNANDALITVPSQALYGIYDDLSLAPSNTVPAVTDADLTISTLSMASASSDTRITSVPSSPWYSQAGKKGWLLALSPTTLDSTTAQLGERVIAPPVRYTVEGIVDAFLFTSIVPGTDDCVAGIDAWITGIDAMTGGYAKVFDEIGSNSIKIAGGSPRGVFVLQDGGDPSLYISQTIFNGNIVSTSFTTQAGGSQTVTINGTPGQTRVLGIKLTKGSLGSAITRQVWRQLR